jgi:hypothetical protein
MQRNLRLSGLLGKVGGSSGPSSFLGNVATRAGLMPNTFNATVTATMSQRWHFLRDSVTSVQLVIPNFLVNISGGGTENTLNGGTTITASICTDPVNGPFTQIKFGGSSSVTTALPFVVSDAVPFVAAVGSKVFTRLFIHNTGGAVFSTWTLSSGASQPGISTGDLFVTSGATDQTMGGTIVPTTGWNGSTHIGVCAILSQTKKVSVALIGDSRNFGSKDTYDASGDLGELSRTIGPQFAYMNMGVESDRAAFWVTNHASRLALCAYASHAIIELGVNDISIAGANAAGVASARATIRGLLGGKPTFETTLPTETTSTDTWMTTTNQTVANDAGGNRGLLNTSVRAGTVGMAGFCDIASVTDTTLTSHIWNADGVTPALWTPDGVHETQHANLAIQSAGVINTALFHRP